MTHEAGQAFWNGEMWMAVNAKADPDFLAVLQGLVKKCADLERRMSKLERPGHYPDLPEAVKEPPQYQDVTTECEVFSVGIGMPSEYGLIMQYRKSGYRLRKVKVDDLVRRDLHGQAFIVEKL